LGRGREPTVVVRISGEVIFESVATTTEGGRNGGLAVVSGSYRRQDGLKKKA
jgi:hypothetical protein